MNRSDFRRIMRSISTSLVIASVMGLGSIANAATDNKKAALAPAKPAPAARPAPTTRSTPAAKPVGNSGGGATHAPASSGATTHAPSANGGGSHGPTANGGGARPATGTTPAHTTPLTGTHSPSTLTSHSAIKTLAPKGSNEHVTKSGSAIRTRPNGKLSDVHDAKRGMDVHRGLNGNQRVSVERPDHSRLVAERGRPGYVQRGYSFRDHDFGRRSYYYHGREYSRFYRGYGYHGVYLNVYSPSIYYGPGFYGWAYNPWATPVAFGWGWGGSPWYGYYGGYFAPYPMYPNASYWLTDYMISQDLQTAYAAHQESGEADDAPATAGGPPELTPDVKQQIADEVRNQLALEYDEAQRTAHQLDVDPGSSGIARMLTDGHPHVFVAGGTLDLVDANGRECAISDGDALALRTPPPADATAANLVVLASKGGQECQKDSTVTVQLTDLQEMQNQMRATIDQGLQELQAKQGKGGLPPAPPSAQAKPIQPEYAAIAPPLDPKDAADIQQQSQQADQAEKEVSAEASQPSAIQ